MVPSTSFLAEVQGRLREVPASFLEMGQCMDIVRNRMFYFVLLSRRSKFGDLILCNRLSPPLIIVLREQLHALATGVCRAFNRPIIPAGNRLMGAKNEQVSEYDGRKELTRDIDQ